VKLWGPCGLLNRYCCTSELITHGPPTPVPTATRTYGPPAPTKATYGPPAPTVGSPTFGPPAPTRPPGSGLHSLMPTEPAGTYLAGFDQAVQFVAVGDQLPVNWVTFKRQRSLGVYLCTDLLRRLTSTSMMPSTHTVPAVTTASAGV
jgi:hypothetical protein